MFFLTELFTKKAIKKFFLVKSVRNVYKVFSLLPPTKLVNEIKEKKLSILIIKRFHPVCVGCKVNFKLKQTLKYSKIKPRTNSFWKLIFSLNLCLILVQKYYWSRFKSTRKWEITNNYPRNHLKWNNNDTWRIFFKRKIEKIII